MKYRNTMVFGRTYHALVTVMVTTFLIFQVFTVAHATTYGEAPHDHDGIACVIDVVAQDDQALLPAVANENRPEFGTYTFVSPIFVSARYVTPPGRAPPPRSPPQ